MISLFSLFYTHRYYKLFTVLENIKIHSNAIFHVFLDLNFVQKLSPILRGSIFSKAFIDSSTLRKL